MLNSYHKFEDDKNSYANEINFLRHNYQNS